MKDVFHIVDGFERWEFKEDSEKVNGLVLFLLEKIRKRIIQHDARAGINIHEAYATSGHSENSQHYKGNAVDFHIITIIDYIIQIELIENILIDLQVENFVGLGIYPTWNSEGFHIDIRGTRARWGYIGGDQVGYEKAKEFAKELDDDKSVSTK